MASKSINPKRYSRILTFTLAVALLASLATAAVASDEASAQAEPAAAPAVKQVESKYVCMVNDSLFAKEQIPVEVEERTYYGCCEMCKERLAKDAGSRQAIDPVSGATVDKATAVIGAQADGSVFYFENEANLEQYNAQHASAEESS